ncbi:MAG: HAD family hydrolase [Clostridia bacterium]
MKKLAVFDFDGTLFENQTIPYFIEQWEKLNYPKANLRRAKAKIIKIYFMNKFKILGKDEFRARAISDFLSAFTNMYQEDIDEFFYKASKDAPLYFNKKVLKEITIAKENNYYTILLSGCYENFLKYIANYLKINSFIGSKINYNEYDKIDFDNPVDILNGNNKLDKLLENFPDIDFKSSIAYADSHTDIELLSSFGKAYAVKPDQTLKEKALENNWIIIE